MTEPTKCSKPKGQYCRLHNPAPSASSLQQKIKEYETKLSVLLEPPFNTEAEIESLNEELSTLSGGVIYIKHDKVNIQGYDIYRVNFDAEHDLSLIVAYPQEGGEPTRVIDYGFDIRTNYSKKNLSFEEAFSESNLSSYAEDNPYYPGRISMSELEQSKPLRKYHEERAEVNFYTSPVNGNVRINYNAVEYANEQYVLERAKIADKVSSFFRKLDKSKSIK
jgi:hypothetical protein